LTTERTDLKINSREDEVKEDAAGSTRPSQAGDFSRPRSLPKQSRAFENLLQAL
jgi:hypothetical protein